MDEKIKTKTELEKMLTGEMYYPGDEELTKIREKAHRLSHDYNNTYEDEYGKREQILKELLPNMGEGTYLQGPISFDYGVFTTFGKNCYANFNLTVLDCCPVNIGDNVLFGPNCTIATALHPFLAEERAEAVEFAKPVVIESDCWIASNVIICAGVKIGKGSVIGAGSVITRDVPPNSLAAGSPCRVIRTLTEKDAMLKK
ncbi:MAG: sugar O-acetyltransferase [Clostridiales bacterium]|nr:sugar O-acetyltransferase [Clostridiales bacterium]